MKAISLWQPWATLIANGAKKIETRGWSTDFRGVIYIHAAKRKNKLEMRQIADHPGYLAALGADNMMDTMYRLENLPYGAIVAVANLVDCVPVERLSSDLLDYPCIGRSGNWNERMLGNYDRGRFGWVLDNVQAIEPIEWKGAQGMFEVPQLATKKVSR